MREKRKRKRKRINFLKKINYFVNVEADPSLWHTKGV
jgi:hypothetical protein